MRYFVPTDKNTRESYIKIAKYSGGHLCIAIHKQTNISEGWIVSLDYILEKLTDNEWREVTEAEAALIL